MNTRVNAVIMVLLMVLSVVASGFNTVPENQNDLDENNSLATQSGGVPCAGDYNLDTNSSHNDSGRGGDVYFSEITGNNVSHFGIVGSNDVLDDYCVVLNPGESITLSSMCASNATDCNNSSIGVKMWSGVFTAWNGSVSWVNLTSSITTLPTYTNNLTTNDTFAFGFTSGDSMFYSYNIWKTGGNSTGGNGSGNNSGGNNTGPMEQIYLRYTYPATNYTTNDNLYFYWVAEDLVTNISYNATFDVYAYNVTTNTTYVIWDDYTVFDSNHTNWNPAWNGSGPSFGDSLWQIPNGTLPTGCYYASINLYDNDDGMYFDNDGFDLDVGMDCSGGSGNNTGNNTGGNNSSAMEWVQAWPGSTNYSTNDIINISWSAGNLLGSGNDAYKVTVDIYAHNSTTNTTYVIWDNFTIFWSTSNFTTDWWNLPSATLPTGCYYASIGLYDYAEGLYFDSDGFDLDVGMDCSGGSGNNTGNASGAFVNAWPTDGNGSISDYEMSSTDANITIGAFNLTNGSNYYLDWQITDLVTGILVDSDVWNWTATNLDRVEWYDAMNLGQGCYYFEVSLYDYTNSWAFVEYEDWPFTIDMTFAECNNTGGNNTGGNNTGNNTGNTTDCGTDDNETVVYSWTDGTTYNYGDIPIASFYVNCTMIGANYTLDYYVYDIITGVSSWSGSWGWTAADIYDNADELLWGLVDGDYCVVASLYRESTFVTDDGGQTCFTVLANNTGGNNTGGNNTGNTTNDCIDNNTATGYHTELSIWTDKTEYVLGETTYGTFYVNCTVVGEDYQLRYWIDAGASYDSGWWNWTATQDTSVMTMNWVLPDAVSGYHLHGELELNGIWLANVESDAFNIVANNSGGNNTGGNNTGGNNTGGNNTGGNNTGNNTVTNTAPQISSLVIAPSSPLESDVLTCSYSYTDAENDPDVSSVTWMINGVPTTTSGQTLSTGYVTGDSVICAVFAYDGMDYGNVQTASVVIAANSTGGSSSGSGLPAIGAVGTLAAIGAGFFAILRREDDE